MFVHSNVSPGSNAVAEKITEDVNPEQLVTELNQVFDSLEAEFKRPPSPHIDEHDDDDAAMEDDSNVISRCKKYLIAMLSEYTLYYLHLYLTPLN